MTNPTPRDSAQLPPLSGLAPWLKATAQSGSPDAPTLLIWAGELEALRAQAASVEPWLSMASAPKDGTAILAPLEGSDMPYPIRWIDDGWEMVWDGDRLSDHDEPRYWMHIPDLPGEAGAPPAHIPADVNDGLHIGACITDGRLYATVMRKERDGCVTVVATAEMDAESLKGHDRIAAMKPQAVAASSPVTAVDAVDEPTLRAMFEAQMSDNGKWANATQRAPDGGYLLLRTAVAWEDWKSCVAALQASRQPQAQQCGGESCEWRGDDDGLWFSSCGGTPWSFEDGGPTENKKMFCIHCGKRLALATKERS